MRKHLNTTLAIMCLCSSPGLAQTFNVTQEFSTFWGGNSRDGCFVQADQAGFIYSMGETKSSDFPVTAGALDTTLSGNSDLYVSKLSPDGKTLVYSTYLGGNGIEGHTWFMKVDDEGCVYVLGGTQSNDLPVTENAIDSTYNGGLDLFIVKLNETGSKLLYCSYFGGSGDEMPADIEIDEEGNIYASAMTTSNNLPVTPNAYDKIRNNDNDIFVVKIDPTQSQPVYSTFVGGANVGEMDIDEKGNCIVTTIARRSDNLPTTIGVFGENYNGGDADAYIVKLNSSGSDIIFATFLGGRSYDQLGDLILDSEGNLVVYGLTYSSNFPTTEGVYDRIYNGNQANLFVTKIDSNASSIICSSFFTGSTEAYTMTMDLDAANNIYVTIIARSPGLPSTPNTFDNTFNGNNDGYFMMVNPDLTQILYATYIGTNGAEYVFSAPGPNCVYLSGASTSPDFPVTENGYFSEYQGGERDGFIMKFNIEQVNSIQKKKSQPTGFKLEQNYPNPFNPSTTIQYSLNKPSQVSLNIYNTQGQKVKNIENSFHSSGEFAVDWDGTDFKGRRVGSGVYFYQLLADNFVIQKKMVLIQ